MEPTKPSSDTDRQYRYIELENEIAVILATDSTAKTAAAAVDVAVGSFEDPADLQGLAHFLEHMLFMGSAKYPDENAYEKFLSDHGGSSNAYTTNEHTVYHFDVEAPHLETALDILGAIFKAPLMDPSSTERELKSVHSEDKRCEKMDSWRIDLVLRATTNQKHPLWKFVGGNLTSLDVEPRQKGIDVRKSLLEFHDTYYSSNLMKVALVGPQSLDELERLARVTFDGILNKKIPLPMHGSQPWLPEQLCHEVFIESVKTCRKISLRWPLPSYISKYAESTLHYLTFLVGHEGAGSLFALLKQKGWATALTASTEGCYREIEFFEVEIELTQEAFQSHREETVVLVYQYLEMLKQKKPQEHIWLELQKINQMTFDNLSKGDPADTATTLVENLTLYAPRDVLRGPYATDVYNPKDIEKTLSLLCPSNMMLVNVAKQFEGITFDQVEKWYQVPYHVRPIPEKLIAKLANFDSLPEALFLPLPNPFIPDSLHIHPFPSILLTNGHTSPFIRAMAKRREETALEFPNVDPMLWDEPECIVDNIRCRAWHLQDELYPTTPKMVLKIFIHSPVTYSTPHEFVLTSLFCQLVTDSLNEYTYDATQAGLKFNVSNVFEGISLGVSGFADKLPVLALRLLSCISDLSIKADRFSLFKQECMRSYSNTDKMQPQTQATDYLDGMVCQPRWTLEEKFSACDTLTLEDMKYHKRVFLRQVKLDVLIHGNIVRDDAMALLEQIQAAFQTSAAVHPGQIICQRAVALPHHTDVQFIKDGRDPENPNSAVVVWYQLCPYLDVLACQILDIGAALIAEKVYDTLRTKEQLGYSVFSEARSQSLSSGLRFVVQGSDHDAAFLLSRIDHCIYEVLIPYLEELPESVFADAKQAEIAIASAKHSSLGQRSRDLWNVVEDGTMEFDRNLRDFRALSSITRDQVVQFMKEGFLRHARVSILVQSLAAKPASDNETSSGSSESTTKETTKKSETLPHRPSITVLKVQDVAAFKNAFPLLSAGLLETATIPALIPERTASMRDVSLQCGPVNEEEEDNESDYEEMEEDGEEESSEEDGSESDD